MLFNAIKFVMAAIGNAQKWTWAKPFEFLGVQSLIFIMRRMKSVSLARGVLKQDNKHEKTWQVSYK